MPCYTVQSQTVEFSASTNADLLERALREMNMTPQKQGQVIYFSGGTYDIATHTLTVRGSEYQAQTLAKQIKVGYAAAVVKDQFQKAGFVVSNAPTATVMMMRR